MNREVRKKMKAAKEWTEELCKNIQKGILLRDEVAHTAFPRA